MDSRKVCFYPLRVAISRQGFSKRLKASRMERVQISVEPTRAEQAPSSPMTATERALSLHIRQSLRPFPMAAQEDGPRERTMESLESMAESPGKVMIFKGSPWHMALAVPWVSAVST